jgi:hypothetical protein
LPTPVGPWSTSGDISPGRDAAISIAPKAMRLLGPTTNSARSLAGRRATGIAGGRGSAGRAGRAACRERPAGRDASSPRAGGALAAGAASQTIRQVRPQASSVAASRSA